MPTQPSSFGNLVKLSAMNAVRTALLELASMHPLLVEAVQRFEADYGDDIPTAGMGDLGSALAANFSVIGEDVIVRLFARCEDLLGGQDEEVSVAIATGFLETFVSTSESLDVSRDTTDKHFGPLAQSHIKAWDEFCGVD